MMKRWLVVALAVGALATCAAPTYAGIFRRGCCQATTSCGGCGGCGATTTSCCGPVAAAPQVTYVDKQVTVCKPVWVDQQVTRTVMDQKMVTKDVPCTYTVMERHTEKQKRQVTECITQTLQEPCSYTVMEQKVTPTQQQVTTYTCQSKTVTEMVARCRTVRVPCVDPCTGCCRMVRTTVTEQVPCCRTVVERIPVTQTVTVNVVTCLPKTVNTTRTVCKVVPVTKTIECDVVVCKPVTKTEIRKVQECVRTPRTITETVKVCKMVTEVQTIKVPVCQPTCSTGGCGTSCCSTGHARHHVLFHRNVCCN